MESDGSKGACTHSHTHIHRHMQENVLKNKNKSFLKEIIHMFEN